MIDRLLSLPILAVAALAVAGCSGTTDVPAASAAQAPATAAGDEPVGSDATDEDTRFNPDEVPVSNEPAEPNDTAEGRAANRRVELVRVDSPVDTH